MWAKMLSGVGAPTTLVNLDKAHRVIANEVVPGDWRAEAHLDLSVIQTGEPQTFISATSYTSRADAEAAAVALVRADNVKES